MRTDADRTKYWRTAVVGSAPATPVLLRSALIGASPPRLLRWPMSVQKSEILPRWSLEVTSIRRRAILVRGGEGGAASEARCGGTTPSDTRRFGETEAIAVLALAQQFRVGQA